MPNDILKTIKPREYQQKIYEKCIDKNCLVVIPTGVGKTLIALMLAINRQKKHPGTKTLFLAPTRPLAEQHLTYFKTHLPELFAELVLFTGKINAEQRKTLWQTSDIIFSTPQCIGNDLKNNLYSLVDVSLLIEDECHRCLKNYSYTYVAEKYIAQTKYPRILGLTASPGTDKKTIEDIAKNLYIDAIEIRTRDSSDVKEYLQELEFEIIPLDLPKELQELTESIRSIYNKKVEELKNRKLLFEPATKTNILKLQSKMMSQIMSGNKHFNLLSGVSASAQAIKLSHLIELLETQTIATSINYIKSIYEQANEKKSKAVAQIIKNPDFNKVYIRLNELSAKKIEHPKLALLKFLIENTLKENPKNKTIIFSQYRDTGIVISKLLNTIPGINAKVFVGQTKKGESGLSQKEQKQIIEEFKIGSINLLVATSIGEEGLDIPEVNSVIFYEPIPSAIRKIQRAGRTARLMKGKLIILLTRNTLDEIYYYASRSKEKKMYKSIESVKKDLENKFKSPPSDLENKEYKKVVFEKKDIHDIFEPKDKQDPKDTEQKTLF